MTLPLLCIKVVALAIGGRCLYDNRSLRAATIPTHEKSYMQLVLVRLQPMRSLPVRALLTCGHYCLCAAVVYA
ncbi:hypothetical protein B296_00019394 [Ensete ventricosum]|uniref:Secreted protein n=1 Tax=Ensete ventricosum TaxID=4639 RepID=A0A426ZFC9_ENSVE|nr:hypothetical protein B296_00019394 [Ensete ventricosum]